MKKISYGEKNDLALDLWVKLARAYTVFSKKTFEQIKTNNLTPPQFAVLECLGHLGSMTIGEISKKILVSSGNSTVIIDNLERDGLVERIRGSNDRRVIKIALTEKGSKLFDDIFSSHADYVGKLASILSTDEQKELANLLKKLGLGLQKSK
ncbi:MAG: MarR family transcriptional regulator [Candidatus Sericytochromatia bacterium]